MKVTRTSNGCTAGVCPNNPVSPMYRSGARPWCLKGRQRCGGIRSMGKQTCVKHTHGGQRTTVTVQRLSSVYDNDDWLTLERNERSRPASWLQRSEVHRSHDRHTKPAAANATHRQHTRFVCAEIFCQPSPLGKSSWSRATTGRTRGKKSETTIVRPRWCKPIATNCAA